jgi:hypothetical protein
MSRAPTIGPTGTAGPASLEPIGFTDPSSAINGPTGPTGSTQPKVIALADRAQEVLEITELEPSNGAFIGKRVNYDGSLTEYPNVTWWRQSAVRVPATTPALFAYLREARKRNICLIRGAPAKAERQPTRRQKAGLYGGEDRGDHGFLDTPTRLLPLDVDGERINWRADPEGAIRTLIAILGEPWASTSFVWFFTTKHGLERDEHKRWTGKIIDGKLYARIVFLTERALNEAEAKALTSIAKACVPALDQRTCLTTQLNYIRRPHWVEHPDRDVLGDTPTIGWVKGTSDYLAVPDDLTYTAHWAQAEGHDNYIADHPDAETAVRAIGSDGEVRPHVMAAVRHLLLANPAPEVVSFADHSGNIIAKLRIMIAQHREEICSNLVRNGRSKDVVDELLQHTKPSWANWLLERPATLKRKTIKLTKEERTENKLEERWRIFARVAWAVETAYCKATNPFDGVAPVTLLPAPVGARKSTLMRAAAVQYVTEQPTKTVVILMPRHKLGDEQIKLLHKEHPEGNYNTAVWRGRHAWNPNVGNGREQKMCRRDADAAAVEEAMIDVEHLCKQGRGEKTIKCPHFDICAYQQQKQVKANIWFAAHECAVHEMPKVFGDVGWVIFDESPLDAFMFGIDINDQIMLGLDTLRTPLPGGQDKFGSIGYPVLMLAREELYRALDKLQVPIEFHLGAAAPNMNTFSEAIFANTACGNLHIGGEFYPHDMRNTTFRGKVEPKIRPDMSSKELRTKLAEAAGNDTIKKEVTLWELVELLGPIKIANNNVIDDIIKNTPYNREEKLRPFIEAASSNKLYGRIQVHRGKNGRIIRMVGLNKLAKGWDVPTLICDATGDPELLKAIWPQLEVAKPHGWGQLPRPQSVRVFQCVNRTISKLMVAVEGKNEKETARKIAGARRLYAAVLTKALEYGGADVGVIVYKSTREWIEKNCFVPEWLKLMHWGDLTGTNTLQKVRALFVIGRPLASPEDVTRQAEALFGAHIPQREYVERRKGGRIPIVPDAKGNNCILVDVWEHPDPTGERLRRQITEGAIIQAAGRARAGLRGKDEPLDLHLWTDVPVPELGPVEPVLWSELAAGPDEIMLAVAGVWLKNIADAARIFSGLFTADGLKTARAQINDKRAGRSRCFLYRDSPIGKTPTPRTILPSARRFTYQRAGAGYKPAEAVFLRGAADPRGWLEERLGPLAYFEIEEVAA